MSLQKRHPDQMGHHRPFRPEQQYTTAVPRYLLRVMRLAAFGISNREIGGLLELSEKTVKNHMYELNQIFHTPSRIAMVLEAMTQGFVPCPHRCRVGRPPQRRKRPASSREPAHIHRRTA